MLESILPSLNVTEAEPYYQEEDFLLRVGRLVPSSAARWEELDC